MIRRAVTVNVEAAHKDASGRVHGHSYLVECWTKKDVDLPMFAASMHAIAIMVDHSLLEDTIGAPTMEAMGQWFLHQSDMLHKVVIRRPTLGFVVEVRK